MKNLKLLLSIVVILQCSTSFAQKFTAQEVADSIKNHFDVNPIEKVYLDLDKSNYVSGETVWFKGYVTAGYFNQFSPLSKVMFVELIDPESKLVKRIKFYSDNGIGNSFLELPQELKTGKYLLRAYTNWMRNRSQGYFFQNELNVFNLFEKEEDNKIAKEEKGNVPAVSFMPEGGELISDVQARVAFKALNSDGYGEKVSGKLFDQNGEIVTSFKSMHLGMGELTLVPDAQKSYYAVLDEYPNSKIQFPQVKEKGLSIYLMNLPQLKEVRFKLSSNNFNKDCFIITHSRGVPTYVASTNLNGAAVSGMIPKDNFLPGVNYMTIFSKEGVPLAERSFFINSVPTFDVEIESDKEVYLKRDKVKLRIASMKGGNGIESYLSLSATNNNEVLLNAEENNIASYFYLTSDLKGYVEAPANYFNEIFDDAWKRLDLLMMTQGYTSFDWDKILKSDANLLQFKIEQALSVSGNLKTDIFKKPAKGGSVSYIVQDSTKIFNEVEVNADGSFEINDLFFAGEKAIVLTGKDKKGKPNVVISIDSTKSYPELMSAKHQISGTLSEFQRKSIQKTLERKEIDASYNFDNNFETLDEVTVKADKITKQDQVNNVYGPGDNSLDLTELDISETAQHPLELIRGRIAGVRISGSLINWQVEIRGPGSINSSTTPLILVDNVQVPLDYLNSISARQIQSVEVYKGASAAIFGVNGANGVLSFFTKPGGESFSTYEAGNAATTILTGYQEFREFYSPDYSVKKEAHAKPDRRALLHWEPMIKTNEEGEYFLEFYTSDEVMDITVRVEGMTQTGQVGMKSTTVKVRNTAE
ncbi:TonB-dependent Receptor Plug Domain [Marivirga sericea]|uniref:TonB-dependent Receptor Plug Domain n=1 Tax=Marivirga sericea TaxID=1028 RepID=A0A1X7L1Y2_9BACT|nr:TonB-dependent receptor plug domain-containing protein [Marivirga sericea]SMG47403.1 TonB-dependent Receptor Plug Domain [Marivirga sericea]